MMRLVGLRDHALTLSQLPGDAFGQLGKGTNREAANEIVRRLPVDHHLAGFTHSLRVGIRLLGRRRQHGDYTKEYATHSAPERWHGRSNENCMLRRTRAQITSQS